MTETATHSEPHVVQANRVAAQTVCEMNWYASSGSCWYGAENAKGGSAVQRERARSRWRKRVRTEAWLRARWRTTSRNENMQPPARHAGGEANHARYDYNRTGNGKQQRCLCNASGKRNVSPNQNGVKRSVRRRKPPSRT